MAQLDCPPPLRAPEMAAWLGHLTMADDVPVQVYGVVLLPTLS